MNNNQSKGNAVTNLISKEFLLDKGVYLGLLILIIISTILSPHFLTVRNVMNILRQWTMIGLMAVGMTFVILCAGIDLSVGAIMAMAATMGAAVYPSLGVAGMIIVVLLAGMAAGLTNGLVIVKGKIPEFIATFGMLTIARGTALLVSQGRIIQIDLPQKFHSFFGRGYLAGIPTPALILLTVVIIANLGLKYTKFGRKVYLTGDNKEAAFRQGIKVNRVVVGVYMFNGLMAGLAGLVFLGRLGVGDPAAGNLFELKAIASVIVGGTPFTGGRGNVIQSFVGLLIIAVTFNILNLLGVSPYVQRVVSGVVIIAAVIVAVRRIKVVD